MVFEIFFIIGSYFIGAIPSGYLLAKYTNGIDVRKLGSGNIGATNINRILGKKLAALTLLLDAGKSFGVVWFGLYLGFFPAIVAISAFFVLIGNCFSVFLEFKGGKGVATTFGIFLALSPQIFLIGFFIYVSMYVFTRISAVGSLSASLFWPLGTYLWLPSYFFLSLFISSLIMVRHHQNIKDLSSKFCKKCHF